jgi:tetratricopeptide (TPR) repeat protein
MLGVVAYYQGRWDEAVEGYEVFATSKERLGDSVHAATGHMNVGEVRSDQGHLDEAVERFRRARRAYVAAGDTLGVAYCLAYLGRVDARAGRTDDADERLREAMESFASLGAEREAAQAEAWLAENALLAGDWSRAAAQSERLLAAPGGDQDAPLLHRVRGEALARLGRGVEARTALDEACRLAEDENADLERALSLAAIARLWPGDPIATEASATAGKLRERLGVVATPEPPA